MFLTLNGFKIKSSSISQKSEDITILNTCINLLQFLSFLNRFLPSLNVSIIWHSNRPKLYTSLVTQTIKNLLEMEETWVWSLGLEDSLEKVLTPHSSTLAWETPWMEEPGRLPSMESPRVWQDWVTSLSVFTFVHWRRKWQPTPVFLPGESQGRGSLVGCRLWGHTESDKTEVT